MTQSGSKKFLKTASFLQNGLIWLVGLVESLLITRFVLRLFAARPGNPFVEAVYALTTPLVAPLAVLDIGQPRFGAVLELSTLTLAICVPVVAYVVWRFIPSRRA
ncbi:MAG: YggT family protein [Chloroflexaceae bacterium]|nr:YggT family protein [Chloroflexaceae bacterium]